MDQDTLKNKNTNMDQKLAELLESLSTKLGTTVEHLYGVLVKQAKISAVISIAQIVILGLLIIPDAFAWNHLLPYCVPKNPHGEYSFDREWPVEIQLAVIFLGLGTIGIAIAIFVSLYNGIESCITAWYNPEASAIQKILTLKS